MANERIHAYERDRAVLNELLDKHPLSRAPAWSAEAVQAAQGVILNDLREKTRELGYTDNAPAGATSEIPEATAGTASPSPDLPAETRTDTKVDLLLICPLAKELNASLLAFDIDPDADEHLNIDGHKIYFCNERKRGPTKQVRVAISVVTKQRNTNCALLTERLISLCDPEVVFLSGIGGGVKDEKKQTLGNVVVSASVLDLAGGRAEPGHVKPRPVPISAPSPIDRQVGYFAPRPREWRTNVIQLTDKLRGLDFVEVPTAAEMNAAPLEVGPGTIVAGEQLIADGRLPELRTNRDDTIRSCDMEGSGFAQACRDQKVQWLIFRGISDYGDPDKAGCEPWHPVAALGAACAARLFIQTQLRLPSEMQTWEQVRKKLASSQSSGDKK